MRRSTKTGRISTAINYITQFFTAHFACRISVAISAFMQFPAFFASCAAEGIDGGVTVRIVRSQSWSHGAADVFVFDNQSPFLLDSYQQFPAGNGPLYVSSGTGEKRIVVLSAREGDLYARAGVQRYQDLCRESFSIMYDDPASPSFYGEITVGEGSSRAATLNVSPLLSSIRVRSVSCNFGGRPYEGMFFHNDRLFLINVVSEFCPLVAEGGRPVSWLNYGSLTDQLPDIVTDGWGDIGPARVHPDVTLYCYPNPKGNPPTRLVLEGSVGDARCYYPIDIDVPEGGRRYVLDITISRMGTADPDSVAVPGTYTVEYETVPWYEKEPVTEDF